MKKIKTLILGLISGAAFGVLFAPKKGKDLRDSITKERKKGGTGFDSLKSELKNMGDDVVGAAKSITDNKDVQNALNKGKETFYDLTGLTKEDLDEYADKARKQADKFKEMASKLKENGEKGVEKTKEAMGKAKTKIDEQMDKAEKTIKKAKKSIKKKS